MPPVLDMERACNRATALVRQILTFGSRHDRDRQVIQLEDAVADAMKLLRATLPAEIAIRSHYAPGLPAVLADSNQIQQIIANLGINACHAIGRRQGLIEIQLDALQVDAELASSSADLKVGRYVRLRFSDNGSGIPLESQPQIFDPFYTTKPVGVGTGIGLGIVQRIVEQYGGTIRFSSEPGNTEFVVRLPNDRG